MIRYLLLLLPLLCCTAAMDAQAWQAGKLSVALQTELQAQPDQPQRIQILLKDRIDPAPMEAQYRRMNLSLAERSAAMIHALRQKAALTQTPVVKTLENLAGVSPGSIKTFWITNLIFCEARPRRHRRAQPRQPRGVDRPRLGRGRARRRGELPRPRRHPTAANRAWMPSVRPSCGGWATPVTVQKCWWLTPATTRNTRLCGRILLITTFP